MPGEKREKEKDANFAILLKYTLAYNIWDNFAFFFSLLLYKIKEYNKSAYESIWQIKERIKKETTAASGVCFLS